MLNLVFSYRIAIALAIIAISSPSILAADENYFPDDTELAVTVNLKQIFNSEIVKAQPDAVDDLKEVLGQFAGIRPVQKYLKEVGLDAFRDLHSITYIYTGSKDPRVSFLMLKGEFNMGKLNDAAKVDSARVHITKSGSYTVYVITPRGEKPIHAALVNPTTLIAATTRDSLADGLARGDGSKQSGLKKELARLLASRDDSQSVTFVSSGSVLSRLIADTTIANADRVATFLQTLDVVSGGITLAKGIQFQLACNAETEEAAKKLTESANGALRILLTLVRQNAEKEPKYLPAADVVAGLRFTNQGNGILFRGEMSLETVEKLMKSFPVTGPNKDQK